MCGLSCDRCTINVCISKMLWRGPKLFEDLEKTLVHLWLPPNCKEWGFLLTISRLFLNSSKLNYTYLITGTQTLTRSLELTSLSFMPSCKPLCLQPLCHRLTKCKLNKALLYVQDFDACMCVYMRVCVWGCVGEVQMKRLSSF